MKLKFSLVVAALAAMATTACGDVAMDEFNATEQALEGNLALGKPATASSVYASGFEAAKAVDGSTSTQWSSVNSDPQWLQVDLGAEYRLSRVRLVWGQAYARTFSVQISKDGTVWSNLYTTKRNRRQTHDLTSQLGSASGRYLRVEGRQRTGNSGYAIAELEAYGASVTPPPPPPPTSANLALNKAASASSVETSGLEAAKAVDGSSGTRWSSAYSDPQWLQVDLGALYQLDRVKLTWEVAFARAFKVQISADGSTFSDLFSTSSNASLTNDLTGLPATAGRYLRVLGTERATGWGYSIFELEAYGQPATTTPPPPPPPPPPAGELVASTVKLSTSNLTAGQALTGTVTYTNGTAAPVTLTNLVITAREPGTTHASGPYYNFSPSPASVTVQPGATHTLQASYTFASTAPAGTWEVFSTYQDGAQTWHDGPSSSFTMTAPATQPPPAPSSFPVIGYYPDWSGTVSAIPFQHLTHIIYSFILPTSSGGLNQTIDPNRLRSLVDLAKPRGIKVLIAVGGWNNGDDSAFETFSGNATARANFVNNIANFITTHRLDGVDIDWEYPDAGQSGINFSLLIRDLAAKLHPMGKLVTAAVGPSHVAGNIPSSTYGDLDLVNIMAYDCGNCGGQNSPYYMAEDLLNRYLSLGVPRSKAILGLPFYSSNATVNETVQKTKLAMAKGGGVMIWEVSMGPTPTLLQAITDTLAGKY